MASKYRPEISVPQVQITNHEAMFFRIFPGRNRHNPVYDPLI